MKLHPSDREWTPAMNKNNIGTLIYILLVTECENKLQDNSYQRINRKDKEPMKMKERQ